MVVRKARRDSGGAWALRCTILLAGCGGVTQTGGATDCDDASDCPRDETCVAGSCRPDDDYDPPVTGSGGSIGAGGRSGSGGKSSACGNGKLESFEDCDGTNLSGQTCMTLS